MLPRARELGKVTSTPHTDRVQIRMVSGQSADDFASRAPNLAHGFGAMLCRVRTGRPGTLILELVRRDALTATITALPVPSQMNLRALHVGRREDGSPWLARLHGTHLLIAGATGAGKGSLTCGMNAVTAWHSDDPCPVCGTGLTYTDDGISNVTQDCALCGWSATWQASLDGDAS